jgi:hypothetical protein
LFLRQFALTLAALCLTLQAAAPAGFMFAGSDEGFPLAVVLCTGDGPVSVAASLLPGHEQDGQAPAGEQKDSPCAFAGSGAGAPAQEPTRLPVAEITYTVVAFAPTVTRAALAVGANAPPPSRAPPFIA